MTTTSYTHSGAHSFSGHGAHFELTIPVDDRRKLAGGWLWLGIASLVGAGLFSLLLVLARTPYIEDVFPWLDFFHTAIVVHVDLSVLVWFLSFGGMLWSLNSTRSSMGLGWAALLLSAVGALIMLVSPFVGAGDPLMSNYIPVLRHPLFFAGLLVFATGIAVLVLRSMTAIPQVGPRADGAGALRFGLNTAAVSTCFALLAFAASYFMIPVTIQGKPYFELLFWGGGHVLQFTYTLLLLVAWLWLASASGVSLRLSARVALFFFALALVTVFFVPLIYYSYDVTDVHHIRLFTWLMMYGGSLATLPLGLALIWGVMFGPGPAAAVRPLRNALITSILLFGLGGGIGFLIQGSNVTIPAHYHGNIVGITLAFMGLTYYMLPRLGFGDPNRKWASIQLYVYGGGQLLHVLGLVWSGGYGVQRKVAGAEQALDSVGRIAGMGLMGLGGLIAIIGGLLFLILVFAAFRRRSALA